MKIGFLGVDSGGLHKALLVQADCQVSSLMEWRLIVGRVYEI